MKNNKRHWSNIYIDFWYIVNIDGILLAYALLRVRFISDHIMHTSHPVLGVGLLMPPSLLSSLRVVTNLQQISANTSQESHEGLLTPPQPSHHSHPPSQTSLPPPSTHPTTSPAPPRSIYPPSTKDPPTYDHRLKGIGHLCRRWLHSATKQRCPSSSMHATNTSA